MIFQFSEKQPLRGHSVTKNRVTGLVTELVTNQLIKFDIIWWAKNEKTRKH